MLRILPKKFDPITISIEDSWDLTQLTFANLFGSLQVHEDKLKKNEEILDQAFQNMSKVVDDKNDFSSTSFRGHRGHGRVIGRDGRGRGRSSNSGRGNFHCTYCKKDGHLEIHCFQKKRDTSHSNLNKEEGENFQTLFLTCNKLEDCDDFTWYLDSCCSTI